MNNKINTGFGGVEFDEAKGFDIFTQEYPLRSKDGLVGTIPSDKIGSLQVVQKFLDEILFERVYCEVIEVGEFSGNYSVGFLINNKFLLNVFRTSEGSLHPSLLVDSSVIKFEYEGATVDNFFKEINKDIDQFSE